MSSYWELVQGMTMKTLECEFKTVSVGKDSTRLGIVVPRAKVSLEEADHMFTGSQIGATATCDPNSDTDADGQQKLGEQDITLDLTADCHGFRATSDKLSVSLRMSKSAVDVAELSRFANRSGKIKCKRTGDAPAKGDNGDDPNEE